MSAPLKGKWAHHYTECVKCNRIKFEHKGRGLCTSCWDKERAKKKSRKETLKKAGKKYYDANKDRNDYKENRLNSGREWRKTKGYKKYLDNRYLKSKIIRFLKRDFILNRDKGNIKMRCPKCDSIVITNMKPKRSEVGGEIDTIKIIEIDMFKKEVINYCGKHHKI